MTMTMTIIIIIMIIIITTRSRRLTLTMWVTWEDGWVLKHMLAMLSTNSARSSAAISLKGHIRVVCVVSICMRHQVTAVAA
jgi:hypothetical protein